MRTDYRTDKNDRAFTKRQDRGFSLVELLVVCVVVVIMSAIALPNIMQLNTTNKLEAPGQQLRSILQQALLHALKNNQPAYAKFDASSGMGYVTNDPSKACASGKPYMSLS